MQREELKERCRCQLKEIHAACMKRVLVFKLLLLNASDGAGEVFRSDGFVSRSLSTPSDVALSLSFFADLYLDEKLVKIHAR